jgi:hypothetical protein
LSFTPSPPCVGLPTCASETIRHPRAAGTFLSPSVRIWSIGLDRPIRNVMWPDHPIRRACTNSGCVSWPGDLDSRAVPGWIGPGTRPVRETGPRRDETAGSSKVATAHPLAVAPTLASKATVAPISESRGDRNLPMCAGARCGGVRRIAIATRRPAEREREGRASCQPGRTSQIAIARRVDKETALLARTVTVKADTPEQSLSSVISPGFCLLTGAYGGDVSAVGGG